MPLHGDLLRKRVYKSAKKAVHIIFFVPVALCFSTFCSLCDSGRLLEAQKLYQVFTLLLRVFRLTRKDIENTFLESESKKFWSCFHFISPCAAVRHKKRFIIFWLTVKMFEGIDEKQKPRKNDGKVVGFKSMFGLVSHTSNVCTRNHIKM